MPRPYRAVLFDVDGTLVDSNAVHARAWVEAFREVGLDVPVERVQPLIGMGGDKLMPEATGLAADDPRLDGLGERRTELFLQRYVGDIGPLPGARALIERLTADGLVIAIATSAKKDELAAILRAGGLEPSLFDTRTSSSDAEHSKPEPDIVEAAVHRAGVPAADCVMIGDTPYDLEAATRAGVDLIGVRSGGWRDADLPGALAVYDDPADLLAHLADSPLAPR